MINNELTLRTGAQLRGPLFSIGLMILGVSVASGQDYPNKPIRLVTSQIGGGSDFTARLIAQGLSDGLGQSVIVDNRPTGVIPGEVVSKSLPNGYSLVVTGNNLWTSPLLQQVPYDPVKDFSPITLSGRSPSILVVHLAVATNSVKELIALAKAKPGALNYASGASGGTLHLAAELFKAMAGVDIVRVNYKGGGPALSALIAGEVQLFFASAGSVMSYVKSGRVRALAVTTRQSSALAPDLPALAASGLPGYELVSIDGILAPAKTPVTVINRLNQEIVRFINKSDVKEKFFNVGIETVGSSPQEFAAFIKSDMSVMGKVIKDAGIRSD